MGGEVCRGGGAASVTADGRRQTADGRRQTADDRRRTTDGRRRTTDGGRQTKPRATYRSIRYYQNRESTHIVRRPSSTQADRK
ncbi:MAG TPA: hypothetical protein ENJ53_03085 [Phaeodactylibacter sp.]|nr:hypothetical protein [Phaeodactylibacter sp.]